MLKIAIRKMAEMYYSALVCNLSNISSTEYPEQHNSGEKKIISALMWLMSPPTAIIVFAHSQQEGMFEHSFKVSGIKFFNVSISSCSCYVWAEKQHHIIMSIRQFSRKKLT